MTAATTAVAYPGDDLVELCVYLAPELNFVVSEGDLGLVEDPQQPYELTTTTLEVQAALAKSPAADETP